MNAHKYTMVIYVVIAEFFTGVTCGAATITAHSASQTDVQSAINSAVTGDIIVVPPGIVTWDSGVTIPNNKKILLRGAGIGMTKITRNAYGAVIDLNLSGSRVTGFEFIEGAIYPDGDGWRIDHCSFSSTSFTNAILILGTRDLQHPTGLIDHCTFHNQRVHVQGGPTMMAHGLWSIPLGLGTNNAVFVEDCVFTTTVYANAIDSEYGGRYVFRYNVVNDRWIESHSVQGTNRASRSWEIYSNTIKQVSRSMWIPIRMRGGTGVIFNNTIVGTFDWPAIALDNVRSCNNVGAGGLADGTSSWDGNTLPTATYQGYPARDQIGRSTDQWLWTDVNPYPPQELDPAYCWNNKYGAKDVIFELYGDCTRQAVHIMANRDYFNKVQKPGYVPYTYPHPLIIEWESGIWAGGEVPSPPSGLRIKQ